jgi:hypothetical protein
MHLFVFFCFHAINIPTKQGTLVQEPLKPNAHYIHPKRVDESPFFSPNPVIFQKKNI